MSATVLGISERGAYLRPASVNCHITLRTEIAQQRNK